MDECVHTLAHISGNRGFEDLVDDHDVRLNQENEDSRILFALL